MNPNEQPKQDVPLDKTTATEEKGFSGTLIFQGIITSEEYNRTLTGVSGYKTYDIMRRSDSTVRQALQIVKLPLLSATRNIEPARDKDGNVTPKAQKYADFAKQQLFERNIDFDQFMKEGLGCFDFGFSVFEKVFGADKFEGQTVIGLSKLASRKQTTIAAWVGENDTEGITQLTADGGKAYIPRIKLAVFTHDREGDNYEGIALLRSIYKDWDIKDKLVLVNAMALEKHGMGMPIVSERDDQTASPDDQAEAEAVLSNVRANEAAFMKIPKTMQVEMMDMKGNTTKEIIPTLNYHDGRIMAGVLARFMELGGSSGTGSQSLSTDLSSLFMKAEETAAKQFASVVNNDIIKQLIDLNFSDGESVGYPTLVFNDIADDDTVALSSSLANLANAGLLTPDMDLEENLRERYNVPEMSESTKKLYEDGTKAGALPGGENTTKVVEAARKRLVETNSPAEAIKAAREIRDMLVEQLNGA